MIKITKKLTEDQKTRGIIFSSCLSESREEMKNDTIHELTGKEEDYNEQRERLLNPSFFNGSHWNFNIVRSS